MQEDVRELVLVVADQALDVDVDVFRNIFIYLDVEHLHVLLLTENLEEMEMKTKGGV